MRENKRTEPTSSVLVLPEPGQLLECQREPRSPSLVWDELTDLGVATRSLLNPYVEGEHDFHSWRQWMSSPDLTPGEVISRLEQLLETIRASRLAFTQARGDSVEVLVGIDRQATCTVKAIGANIEAVKREVLGKLERWELSGWSQLLMRQEMPRTSKSKGKDASCFVFLPASADADEARYGEASDDRRRAVGYLRGRVTRVEFYQDFWRASDRFKVSSNHKVFPPPSSFK